MDDGIVGSAPIDLHEEGIGGGAGSCGAATGQIVAVPSTNNYWDCGRVSSRKRIEANNLTVCTREARHTKQGKEETTVRSTVEIRYLL